VGRWGYARAHLRLDTLARLSVYEVPSSARAHTALVAKLLPPRAALPHTLAVVVLDWTKPWTFVDELETWLLWLDAWAQGDADGARETQIVREECRERRKCILIYNTVPPR
jgi:dynein light intermediate chain 1